MSVAKAGADDGDCGVNNSDILHQAICRLVAGGTYGRRRGRQRPRLGLEARPGGLQRGHHRLGPRRHGRQARRPRRQPLLLVGRLRQGRHVRRLQQLRQRRRPDRAGQVHLVDEARELVPVHVRDVHGRPGGDRRGRPLQVEPPERDAGRGQGGAPVPRHLDWKTSTDPDSVPREAPRRLEARAARDVQPRHRVGARSRRRPAARLAVPVTLTRSARSSSASASRSPRAIRLDGDASRPPASSAGPRTRRSITVHAPDPIPRRHVSHRDLGHQPWAARNRHRHRRRRERQADREGRRRGIRRTGTLGTHDGAGHARLAVRPRSHLLVASYELQLRRSGGGWGPTIALPASARSTIRSLALGVSYDAQIRATRPRRELERMGAVAPVDPRGRRRRSAAPRSATRRPGRERPARRP